MCNSSRNIATMVGRIPTANLRLRNFAINIFLNSFCNIIFVFINVSVIISINQRHVFQSLGNQSCFNRSITISWLSRLVLWTHMKTNQLICTFESATACQSITDLLSSMLSFSKIIDNSCRISLIITQTMIKWACQKQKSYTWLKTLADSWLITLLLLFQCIRRPISYYIHSNHWIKNVGYGPGADMLPC